MTNNLFLKSLSEKLTRIDKIYKRYHEESNSNENDINIQEDKRQFKLYII